jgi:hypothetical protein
MKALIKFMSEKNNFAYVCSAPDSATKQKRIAELKQKFQSQSDFAKFSADIADLGNPSGVYDSDDFATFNQKAKEKAAFDDIKRLTLVHSVKDSVKTYLLQRNSVIKANKDKAKLKEKEKENKHVSHPNWY